MQCKESESEILLLCDRMSTVQCRIDHRTEEDCYDMFIIGKQGKSKIYILNEKVEEQTVILLALLV